MSRDPAIKRPSGNKILGALSDKDLKRIRTKLERFDLHFGEIIYETGDPIEKVYFPDSGIISLLATLGKESVLEVGIVGNDGVVGLSSFLDKAVSRGRAVVQGDGIAYAMETRDFRVESDANPAFSKLLLKYSHSLIIQISQSAVCYRFHKIDARLSRWLLMTADLMVSDEFRLTQEFLSHMLGVRREGVSNAANQLQKQEIIQYSRGNITILDRKNLERTSCPCYSILKDN